VDNQSFRLFGCFLYIGQGETSNERGVQKAESGHPGLPLDAAPMAYVLWARFLEHNPRNPQWLNRDRFVLSARHGSALLYSLLHLTGYEVPLDQIKRFRQWGKYYARPSRAWSDSWRGNHHRPTRPRIRQWRGHGDFGSAPCGALEPAGI